MIRIAIVADSHADETRRFDEHRRVMNWVAKDIRARGCHLVAHAGDVWERRSTSLERAAVGDWCREVTEDAPLAVVRGNHDDELDIEWLGKLRTKQPIHTFTRPGVLQIAGVVVGALPWPKRAQLVAHLGPDFPAESVGQAATQCLRNVLGGLGDEMGRHGGPRLLLAHAMICGSKTDHDQPIVGADMELDVSDLALARAHFTGVGHVHAQSEYLWDGATIANIGSPIRQNFGEPGPKGYIIVEFDGETVRWERIATPATPMLLLEGDWRAEAGLVLTRQTADLDVRGAELRLRYTCESDRRVAAKASALEMRDAWLDAGAVSVKVEEEVTPVTRARAPEVAAAETTEDQLVAFWKARDLWPSEPRRLRLLAKLAEVVGPAEQGARRRGALRYTGIRHRGFATMQPVDIDFDATPGPLVALVGPNGSGKSTTCELLFGALHGDMPTRGSLGTLATARDARLEVGVCTQEGARYSIRHDVDGQTRKGTVFLADAAGRPVLPDTQVSKFYPWIAERTPPASVVAASMFASQATRGLLGMKEGELKAVILRAIGCEALEDWAKTCRENARTAKGKLDVAAGRLADERARGVPRKTAELRLAGAEEAVVRALNAVAEAGATVQRAKVAEETFREESRHLVAAKERIDAASAVYDAARAKLGQLEARMTADRLLVAEGAAIVVAAGELEALTQREASLREEVGKAKAAADVAAAEARAAGAALADARKRYAEIADRVKRAEARLAERPMLEEARARAEALRGEFAAAEKAEEDARAEMTRLQGVALVGAEGRIEKLRGGLTQIAGAKPVNGGPWNGPTITGFARDVLAQDNHLVEQAKTIPVQLSNAKNAVMAANARKRQLAEEVARAEKLAAGLPALEAIAAELVQLREDLAKATEAGTQAKAADAAAATALIERSHHHAGVTGQLAPLAAERARLAPLAARAPDLAAATARLEALEPELRAARTAAEAAGNEFAAQKLPAVTPFDPRTLADATKAHELAWEGERQAREALAAQAREAETAKASEARQAELEAERARAEEDVADWTHLADALGRDGIQALLIDAAGPKLTTLANDLLHACHGPRFTVRIDAAPFTADGKRQTEGCEIQVLDTKPREDGTVGGEREGCTFSGGERALLNEALGLALTMHVCQRSGLREPTLVRDETGAALDPENGQAYVAMLRRAAAQVGAHRVIFVSHDPAMAALADGCIDLGVARVAKPVVAAAESGPAEMAPKKRRARKAVAA